MSTIAVIGGTGYTGTNIAREAASRGHGVVSWSRHLPAAPVGGVRYETGAAADAAAIIPGADVVVLTLSPRGELAGKGTQLGLYQEYAASAAETGARLIVVGGFSSLRPAPDEPRFAEGEIPEQFREEALEGESIRAWLAGSAPEGLDWVFVSPAGGYGSWAAGEKAGVYRVGGEVALFDAEGRSEISGPDFADAIVNEIEHPEHHRTHLSVAY
ncbi:NAD(P)H-binding protein [Nocardioides sp. CER19]|uniref:NAD(P)-dependent oxidoreductase n=1 Tax=Nocardioides sp. CER19 TaxID=3038538 RepID=UPI00244C3F7A|nr:NAD(P)H-binding protein [Nocardioides sp. CER19]MDH2413644.1 NAD(P)H-binding protein [Nocardioides sp. CER19]